MGVGVARPGAFAIWCQFEPGTRSAQPKIFVSRGQAIDSHVGSMLIIIIYTYGKLQRGFSAVIEMFHVPEFPADGAEQGGRGGAQ
jgi:hypothetical protein